MSRPQATTAFIPISNRAAPSRPAGASSFMSPEVAAETHGWYNITSKKRADKVVAEVMIFGEIGWEVTAREFVKDLTLLEADQINVRINSVGGDVFDGVAIYNALRQKDADVYVYVEGLAASAASFIAQAGDEVIMLTGSQMMIHDASAMAWGNEEVMLDTADVLSRISNSIADIYAQRAGGKAEDWRAIMKAEMWYSPEEAVTAGLADSVLADENKDAQAAKDTWDLRVFNFAGRKEAPNPRDETLKIINRAKEAPVTPKITDEGEQVTSEVPVAPAEPEAPATDPPVEDEEVAGANGDGAVVPEAAPPAPVVPPAVENRAGVFMVNGVSTTDPKAVQNHITVLETFAKETREAARKTFIEALAAGNKIAATQIGAIEALVATMNDEQYDMWAASWEAAPNISLLGTHGETNGGTPSGTAATAASEEIETLKEIVNRHVMGRMKREQIEATDSFKKLKALEPTFTLDKK
jgi:ATP-dependent protease ClpP protease subunit